MLEVIDKGSCSESHPAPLLFVHGAWHAAWCWDENFLGFFADKGYGAVALSLRNRGNSDKNNPRKSSVADLVSDVASVANDLPAEPVVIGHSMGGLCGAKVPREAQRPRRRPPRVGACDRGQPRPTPHNGASSIAFRTSHTHR